MVCPSCEALWNYGVLLNRKAFDADISPSLYPMGITVDFTYQHLLVEFVDVVRTHDSSH